MYTRRRRYTGNANIIKLQIIQLIFLYNFNDDVMNVSSLALVCNNTFLYTSIILYIIISIIIFDCR